MTLFAAITPSRVTTALPEPETSTTDLLKKTGGLDHGPIPLGRPSALTESALMNVTERRRQPW